MPPTATDTKQRSAPPCARGGSAGTAQTEGPRPPSIPLSAGGRGGAEGRSGARGGAGPSGGASRHGARPPPGAESAAPGRKAEKITPVPTWPPTDVGGRRSSGGACGAEGSGPHHRGGCERIPPPRGTAAPPPAPPIPPPLCVRPSSPPLPPSPGGWSRFTPNSPRSLRPRHITDRGLLLPPPTRLSPSPLRAVPQPRERSAGGIGRQAEGRGGAGGGGAAAGGYTRSRRTPHTHKKGTGRRRETVTSLPAGTRCAARIGER